MVACELCAFRGSLSSEPQNLVSCSASKIYPRHRVRSLYLHRKSASLAWKRAGHSQLRTEYPYVLTTFTELSDVGAEWLASAIASLVSSSTVSLKSSPGPPIVCHVSSSQLKVWRGKISSHRLILGNWGRLGSGAGWAHGGKVRLHCTAHRLSQLVRKASLSDFIMVRVALTHINSTGVEAVTLSPRAVTFVSAAGEHHTTTLLLSDKLLSEQMCVHRVNAYHLGGSHSETVFIHKCMLARINLISFWPMCALHVPSSFP